MSNVFASKFACSPALTHLLFHLVNLWSSCRALNFDRRDGCYFDVDVVWTTHVWLKCRRHNSKIPSNTLWLLRCNSKKLHNVKAESSRPVIFRLFTDKLRRSCRVDTVPTTLNAYTATKIAYVRCCHRRTDNQVTTILFCWRYATTTMSSSTGRLRQRAAVSNTSPTPQSADATSRLIAPSATAWTPGCRQRQACADTGS